MRLIDADALTMLLHDDIDGLDEEFPNDKQVKPYMCGVKMALSFIDTAPTVDAVPVVRCKDCKHWDKHSQYGYDNENGVYGNYCKLWTPEDDFYAVETPADGFCYNGERKDDD